MTTQDIAEEIIFNALEIAEEIKESEDEISRLYSNSAKNFARAGAYQNILELIYGGEQE